MHVARRIASPDLSTRTARLRLPVARKPVFIKLARGLSLGYRRNQTAGAWIIRRSDGKGGNWLRSIGNADDYDEVAGLTYQQAQDQARVLARGGDSAHADEPTTVGMALDAYEADLTTRGAEANNARRVRRCLPAAMLGKPIVLLTATELSRWRNDLLQRLAPASVNRTLASIRAALNLAAAHDERIVSRRAWTVGLPSIPGAQRARNVVLSEPVIRDIIGEARKLSAEFGLFVEVAAVTGARVSQIARLEVADLQADRDAPRLMMPSSRKGRGVKRITRYPVPLPPGLAARLRALTVDRPVTAPLLTRPSGEPWSRGDHSRPFAAAAEAAGQDPEIVTVYALRHSSITRQLLAGTPIRIVAVAHDTSTPMVEKNYTSSIGDHADAMLRGAMLDLPDTAEGNVVTLPPRRRRK